MTALIIIAAVLLFVALILILPIRVFAGYDGENICAYIKILFIKIRLFPKKEKKPSVKKLIKGIGAKPSGKAEKKEVPDTFSLIKELKDTLLELTELFFGYLKIRYVKFILIISSNNAAKTALMYGAATQGFAYLSELIKLNSNLRVGQRAKILITTDFTTTKTRADILLGFNIRVIHLLIVGIKFIIAYFEAKRKGEK